MRLLLCTDRRFGEHVAKIRNLSVHTETESERSIPGDCI